MLPANRPRQDLQNRVREKVYAVALSALFPLQACSQAASPSTDDLTISPSDNTPTTATGGTAGAAPSVTGGSGSTGGSSSVGANNQVDPNEEFTFVVVPDTQYMIASQNAQMPDHFRTQLRWIVSQKEKLNIKFVSHVGDLVEHGGNQSEWSLASDIMTILEEGGLAYGAAPGNHDTDALVDASFWQNQNYSGWSNFDTHFPQSRFGQYAYFGGNFPGTSVENNYEFFSAAGLEFIVLHLHYQAQADVKAWAKSVLEANSEKRAIISTHDPREAIPNELAAEHSNVFMLIGGHHCDRESLEALKNEAGGTYYQIMQDYQGDGYGGFCNWPPNKNFVTANTRYFTFKPAMNEIHAFTYSPVRDEYENDESSQFVLPYVMH